MKYFLGHFENIKFQLKHAVVTSRHTVIPEPYPINIFGVNFTKIVWEIWVANQSA